MLPQDNYYAHHLAEVNTEKAVVAAEDICNEQGVLLIAKGSALSHAQAELVVKHKLVKPLDLSVDIAGSLDADDLGGYLLELIAERPLFQAVMTPELQAAIQRGCLRYQEFPLLRQKLTVLSQRLQWLFSRSLLNGVAALAIALKMDLSAEEQEAAFLGGIFHCVGYLHLSPELLSSEGGYSAEQWREIQAQPVIASRFLAAVEGLSSTVVEAVADHCECTDGSGYPARKFGDQLGVVSQIIALTDMFNSRFRRYQKHGEHTYTLLMAALQFNDTQHFEAVYRAAILLFQQGPCPAGEPSHVPEVSELLRRQAQTKERFVAMRDLSQQLMRYVKSPYSHSVAAMLMHLSISLNRSGLLQPEYRLWLEELAEQEQPVDGMELLRELVMLDEIDYQMDRLQPLVKHIIDAIPASKVQLQEVALKVYGALLAKDQSEAQLA